MYSLFYFLLTLTCMLSLHFSQSFDPKILLPTSDEELNLHSVGSSITNITHLQTYIVHVNLPYTNEENKSIPLQELESLYFSFLPPTIDRQKRMVHCYNHVITGFAARLSEEEVKLMEKKDGFISASPELNIPLQTTHSQAFMGLQDNTGFWRDSNYGIGVIIGVLDSGIALNHPSFGDAGVPQPPSRWRGRCDLGAQTCNNKVIGARNFLPFETPEDTTGHGSHVAGIAAGNGVVGANVFGQATGEASGTAPGAHLAIYKVCNRNGCPESSILAGINQAIDDGVDVINLSLGSTVVPQPPFHSDNTAIGAFAAIQRGIFVSSAATNTGPGSSTLSNQAPWHLTVGASTIDRNIRATAILGNGVQYIGESLRQPNNFPPTLLPLVYPGRNGIQQAAQCFPEAFNNINVRGMIVVCDAGGPNIERVEQGQNVLNAGGAAMILVNEQVNGDSIPAENGHVLPAIHVAYRNGTLIKTYINSTPSPQATIVFAGTVYSVDYAPEVASFSSRGPNTVSPGILKPDIIGPGRNILSASPFSVDGTTTRVTFNIMSGTSMATPHLSGIAALLKNTRPNWSPAAMKSAIMTTATVLNRNNIPITDQNRLEANWYDTGAGHVVPTRVNDPGLVYDIQPDDYIPYLCGLGYTDPQVSIILHRQVRCSTVFPIQEAQLNYPTFSISLGSQIADQTYTRRVTNVGDAISSYDVSVNMPSSVSVVVLPTRLTFTSINQQVQYTVSFRRTVNTGPMVVRGHLTWTSPTRTVRSQIVAVLP